jgi:hypothetical protein
MNAAQHTPGPRVEARYERVGGVDEVVAWEVWDGDEWLDLFDNEPDALDYCAAIAKATGAPL